MKKNKEVYRLWVEYLKRSDNYKAFCDLVRKKKEDPSITFPHNLKKICYPANYHIFGSIHNPTWSFNEWWEHLQKMLTLHDHFPVKYYILRRILKVEDEWKLDKIIEDYADMVERDVEICIAQFKFHNKGKEPTLEEFKKAFVHELREGNLSQWITIRINPFGIETGCVIKQLKSFIKAKLTSSRVKTKEVEANQYLRPSTRYIRIDELKKYLDVYDLRKKKLEPMDIIKKINPNDDANDENVKRAYRDFYQKAKKIIQFVEQGVFPGPYDGTTINRKKRNAKSL